MKAVCVICKAESEFLCNIDMNGGLQRLETYKKRTFSVPPF
jgi:hypothetical protein